ncbi:putative Chromate transport protein ChrA [Vibrio nigripulchritudo SFn27]|uniref:Putative Chromate transport protein ChrA n=1 Tax=Vibrio nigripulchritudo TaxID=28173 RepID=U4K9B9_9VIBR|nr:chromate efflux transporter [Vibrio nigripulchritudo]CCN83140.1 putative Chromate transport protein ChrA [Vibrio nigripulchritudo BLFn1]CCN86256.1 putative Chromate transport protein ChrA [Vibrio nigripulchritudo SFn27]CCN92816.1 putative Chromate transport protein ChrA [Vibrio nigripulchritudo ENn2]CCO42748.1 putative Chromate transport protein ChrA [Vibrio nigripulchritudo SFn135]CCO52615.1 putative Chromate transport protein ChrA [Vibrio nigripulchritudo Wn13]
MFSIFKTFFLLGWVSFGGPAAHIGYFRNTFVEKLKWLSETEYAQIVALSQFLPGPGSSQVGFALGYRKGGITGAIAAFLGFTFPSVILMLLLAVLSSQLTDSSVFQSIIHGLKLLAVVVVADATIGMYKNFCQQKVTIALCVATAMALLLFPNLYTQMIVLVVAALVGQALLRGDQANTESREPTQVSWLPLVLFAALLFGLPVLGNLATEIRLFSDFYQAGSLVFGGGHVVLPLLQNIVGDQLSQDAFLTGYAAAQAVPGPMFTFATYIGYELLPASPILGALLATLAVFLPGFLLLLAVLNNWQELASRPKLSGAVAGVNASVVGLLLAALYQPVFTSAVLSGADMAVVVAGFYLLKQRKLPIVALVAFFIGVGMLLGML